MKAFASTSALQCGLTAGVDIANTLSCYVNMVIQRRGGSVGAQPLLQNSQLTAGTLQASETLRMRLSTCGSDVYLRVELSNGSRCAPCFQSGRGLHAVLPFSTSAYGQNNMQNSGCYQHIGHSETTKKATTLTGRRHRAVKQ